LEKGQHHLRNCFNSLTRSH